MNEISPTKHVKAGASAQATAERRGSFVEAYLTNGHNGAEAAKAAGYASKHAKREAARLLALPAVRQLVSARARQVAERAEMSTEAWARQLTAITYSDAADLYDGAGNPIPLHQLPERVRLAIQSVDVVKTRDGEERTKIRFWNKNQALEMIGKHLGLFERDNAQQKSDVRVQIVLVGG